MGIVGLNTSQQLRSGWFKVDIVRRQTRGRRTPKQPDPHENYMSLVDAEPIGPKNKVASCSILPKIDYDANLIWETTVYDTSCASEQGHTQDSSD